MAVPGWTTEGRSHRHDGYRIDPNQGPPPGGWILNAEDPPHPVIPSINQSEFSSLKAAKAAAIHHQILATRRIKLIRHIVLATVAGVAAMPAFALMGPGTSTRRVLFFALGLVFVLVALRELVGIVVIVFSEGWDYAYDMPRVSRIDAVVSDMASALIHAPASVETNNDTPVHVIEMTEYDHLK